MIIIKDRINYLEEISAAHTAANDELKALLLFLCRKIYALHYKGDYTIDFYGSPPSAENDAEPYLHWESNNIILDQLIIFFLEEYNTQNQQK